MQQVQDRGQQKNAGDARKGLKKVWICMIASSENQRNTTHLDKLYLNKAGAEKWLTQKEAEIKEAKRLYDQHEKEHTIPYSVYSGWCYTHNLRNRYDEAYIAEEEVLSEE
jgi:hypothetical protein